MKNLFPFIIIILFTACGTKQQPKEDYLSYLEPEAPTYSFNAAQMDSIKIHGLLQNIGSADYRKANGRSTVAQLASEAEDIASARKILKSITLNNDTIRSLKATLKELEKDFPAIRKKYADISKEKLWEENIDVKLSGKENEIITFVGASFASNKNIKASEDAIHDMLKTLQFKRVNYKWYKGDNDFTYYDLN